MLAKFEHGRGKGCVREEFSYVQKLCKDYRLEAEWEENDAKCFDAAKNRSGGLTSYTLFTNNISLEPPHVVILF